MPIGFCIIFVERKKIFFFFFSNKPMPSVNLKLYRFYWMCSKQEMCPQKVYEKPESWDIIFFQHLKSTLEDQETMGK